MGLADGFMMVGLAVCSYLSAIFSGNWVVSLWQMHIFKDIWRINVCLNISYISLSNRFYCYVSFLNYFKKYQRGRRHFSRLTQGINGLTHSCLQPCNGQKQPDIVDEISQAKTKFWKYSMKKCYSEHYQQLSFKYFVKSFLIRKLSSKV